MFEPKLKDYLIGSLVFLIGLFITLIPSFNWLFAVVVRIGHSLILLGIFYLISIILNISKFKGLSKTLDGLFLNETAEFVEMPWIIQKNYTKIIIKIYKRFYYQALFLIIIIMILIYYIFLPLDLALRNFTSITFMISPAFLLGIFTVALMIIIFVILYTLRRNKKILINKEKGEIVFAKKKTPIEIDSSINKNFFTLPIENLRSSKIQHIEYYQILIPLNGVTGDREFIEDETKNLPENQMVLIQSAKEEFIKMLHRRLLEFFKLDNE